MNAPSYAEGGVEATWALRKRLGRPSENAYWLDPNAIVQTGFGVPTWSWTGYTLSFDGPVEEGAMMHLYLLPPWAFRIVAALRAVLLLVLLGVLLLKRPKAPTDETPSTDGGSNAPSAAALGSVAILLITMLASVTLARREAPRSGCWNMDVLLIMLALKPQGAEPGLNPVAGRQVMTETVHKDAARVLGRPWREARRRYIGQV